MTAEDPAGPDTGDLRDDEADAPTALAHPDPTEAAAPAEPGDAADAADPNPVDGLAAGAPEPVAAAAAVGPIRRVLRVVATVLACLLVLFALIAPEDINNLSAWQFVRLPIEALVAVAILLLLPRRARTVTAAVLGAVLGVLAILKMFDMGFYVSLARPFDPVFDWSFLAPGLNFVSGVFGKAGAIIAVVLAVVVGLALVLFMTLSVLRLTRIVVGHRTRAFQIAGALAVVWLVFTVFDVQLSPGVPIAADDAATLAYDNVRQVSADLNDSANFAKEMSVDAFSGTPASQLLTALRGKNVLLVFVESYGRVSVEAPDISPGVNAVLAAGTAKLHAAGFDTRSAFLTSPTTGGGSWLPHSTVESGLWINNSKRYSTFTSSTRFTLSDAFKKAGWHTVDDIPENHEDWPEGRVYNWDQIYDARNVGYQGPNFSYADIPDQYTLATFQQNVLSHPGHQPVYAELDLISSHTPWTPIPRIVPWNEVGNGSIYDPMPAQGKQVDQVWPDPAKIHQAFGESIQYSLNSLISYLLTYGDNNTVMVFVGDHQPSPAVVGDHASHDAPVAIVAKDPAVMDRISSWGWQEGLKPSPNAPVWPMSDFRDKFLTAFDSQSH